MSTAAWFQGLLRGNPELFRQISDWNLYPHRWALPVWLATVPGLAPEVIQLLERTPRGRERLGHYVRARLGLTATCWDFEAPVRRLALLPAASLARLARFTGAACHWLSLTRAVSQRDHQAVVARLGADARAFALRRGRVLLTQAGLPPLTNPANLDSPQVEATGWSVIKASLSGGPAPLLLRTNLKCPPGLPDTPPLPAEGCWTLLQSIFPETLSPADRTCFA